MKSSVLKALLFIFFAVFVIVSVSAVSAADNAFVGKWGYTALVKSISSSSPPPWYGTWKNEVGTITFNADGTAVSVYKESAQICPDENYCKTSDTENHTYVVNSDGSATLDGALKLVMSADGRVAIGDGTFSSSELLFFTAVRIIASHTYTASDVNGDCYAVSYEHDMTGGEKGYYRVESIISSKDNGIMNRSGTMNGDGTIHNINEGPMTFTVSADGYMDIGSGLVTGYVGYDNLLLSNARGGAADDFMSVIGLKKQDRSYTQADLSGTWTASAFGDKQTDVRAEFGTITCDAAGNCTAEFMQRKSDGTLASKTRTLSTLLVSADGSINSFLLTSVIPHFSGAIGNDGKVMLLAMNPESVNDRIIAVAVKNASSAATIAISGKVQDPNGNYVSGIKVEVAENTSIPAVYTNSNGEFSVAGVPSGQDFTLRFTMDGALPTYTPIFNFVENTSLLSTYFRMYPANWKSSVGNTADMGIIHGRIRENGANWEVSTISGATVSPSTGTAEYTPDQITFNTTSTFGNGQWFVRNVAPDTIVEISGTKAGTTMPSRRYKAFADGVTSGSLFATAHAGTIWVSGKAMNNNSPVGGATVAMVTDNTSGATGTPGTTTKGDGSFTLTGLPSGSFFYLKITKDGFVPTYVAYSSTSNYVDYPRPYPLYTQQQLNDMGIATGKGMIAGKTRNNSDPNLAPVEGVGIAYTSSQGNTYRIKYYNGQSLVDGKATYDNGGFNIYDVAEGDSVSVRGEKTCWDFQDRTYVTHGSSVILSSIRGVHTENCTEQATVQNSFQAAIDAYNQKNPDFLTNYVSQNYLDKGETFSTFSANVQSDWSDPNFQSRTYTVNGTTFVGSDTAVINITWMNGENDTIYLKKEGETWKMYGNQELYSVSAYSFRQQYTMDDTYQTPSGKYYAGFSIDDPTHSIISATVSGTGISGSLNFANERGSYWWPQPVEFGASPPSNATYTITINDAGGQHTYSRIVNGGVAAYAANLKPTGDVSGSITFTFNGIPGGQRYHIELFDANWNWVWGTENDNVSTSIAYNGPALQTGTYRYIVSSFIGDNQSQTWEQFVYTASPTPTISVTGKVTDVNGNAINGAAITKAGDTSIQTTSNATGDFTLTGLPSDTPFSIRIYKEGFVPVFSANINSTSNITSLRPYKLFMPEQIASWGIQESKGVINGVVADKNNPSAGLSGATLTATGNGGKSYPVTYETVDALFGGTATSANGHYYVLNVDDMDTVTVSVTLPGYSFLQSQRIFVAHAGAMDEGSFFGESTGATETISLVSGWNFVSFPKLPTDKSIVSVFAGISSNIRVIWSYDNSSKTWKTYKPGAADNNISYIEGGKGYWVYMNASGTINISEWAAQSTTVPLAEGWNLIAYNGTDDTDVATALNGISGKWSIVWYWKDNQWYAKHATETLSMLVLDKFKQGRAYWINIKTGQATDWVQP
jgi:hypothetical protein